MDSAPAVAARVHVQPGEGILIAKDGSPLIAAIEHVVERIVLVYA